MLVLNIFARAHAKLHAVLATPTPCPTRIVNNVGICLEVLPSSLNKLSSLLLPTLLASPGCFQLPARLHGGPQRRTLSRGDPALLRQRREVSAGARDSRGRRYVPLRR